MNRDNISAALDEARRVEEVMDEKRGGETGTHLSERERLGERLAAQLAGIGSVTCAHERRASVPTREWIRARRGPEARSPGSKSPERERAQDAPVCICRCRMTFCRCLKTLLSSLASLLRSHSSSSSASPSPSPLTHAVDRSHPTHSHVYRARPLPTCAVLRCSISSPVVVKLSAHPRQLHVWSSAGGAAAAAASAPPRSRSMPKPASAADDVEGEGGVAAFEPGWRAKADEVEVGKAGGGGGGVRALAVLARVEGRVRLPVAAPTAAACAAP